MISFWRNLSNKDKRLVCYFLLFIAALLLTVWFCHHRNGSATLSGFKPMSLEYVKACTPAGICKDEVLLLNGQVVKNSKATVAKELQDALDRNPGIRTVCFNSPGGDNDAAEVIGKKIASLNLNTCFAGKYLMANGKFVDKTICNSVCPLIFLAGQERVSYGEALVVGLHSSGIYCEFCGFKIWEDESKEAMSSLENLLRSYSVINPHRTSYDSYHLKLLSLGFKVSHKGIGTLSSRQGLTDFHFYTTIIP